MSTLIFLLLLGLALWFWADSLRAREQAREACGRACQRCQVQLLDDTVALQRIGLRRGRGDGRLQLERLYGFEFTDTGATRRRGSVVMRGRQVQVVQMEPNDLLMP